jgi:hypothetical protein
MGKKANPSRKWMCGVMESANIDAGMPQNILYLCLKHIDSICDFLGSMESVAVIREGYRDTLPFERVPCIRFSIEVSAPLINFLSAYQEVSQVPTDI